jgi:hypothetical protein
MSDTPHIGATLLRMRRYRESTIETDAELAAGADLVRRHVLLPAIGALIGDERQRDEDDRGRQQARPVIVAGQTLEPIVVRDPLAGCLRHVGDLVSQIPPPPVPPGPRIDRAANGTIRTMPRSAAQNRKPSQPSYAATVAKSLTACANAALLHAGAIEIALMPNDDSVADLTFLSALPRVIHRNVKSKATLLSYSCQCPFGSDVRTSACCKRIRTSEPGHSPSNRAARAR